MRRRTRRPPVCVPCPALPLSLSVRVCVCVCQFSVILIHIPEGSPSAAITHLMRSISLDEDSRRDETRRDERKRACSVLEGTFNVLYIFFCVCCLVDISLFFHAQHDRMDVRCVHDLILYLPFCVTNVSEMRHHTRKHASRNGHLGDVRCTVNNIRKPHDCTARTPCPPPRKWQPRRAS